MNRYQEQVAEAIRLWEEDFERALLSPLPLVPKVKLTKRQRIKALFRDISLGKWITRKLMDHYGIYEDTL